MFITSTIAKELKIDLNTLVLSRNAIRESRANIRQMEYEKMKKLLQDVDVSFMIVQWDCKIIPDEMLCKKIDRLPVFVSTDKFTKIINGRALENGKAITIASEVHEALQN